MGWFRKLQCIHFMAYYAIIKANEPHLYVSSWKGVEDILLSENKQDSRIIWRARSCFSKKEKQDSKSVILCISVEVWNDTHQHANTSYLKKMGSDRGGREDF